MCIQSKKLIITREAHLLELPVLHSFLSSVFLDVQIDGVVSIIFLLTQWQTFKLPSK